MSHSIFRGAVQETDDDGDLQTVRLLGPRGEELTKVHRPMPFGLASHAPVGSHGIGLAAHGERELAVLLGAEHADKRPRKQAAGETTIYNGHGQAVSIVKNAVRIAGGETITLTAGTIILAGVVKLGSADANRELALKGSTDSAGHTETGNLATKVYGI